MAPRVGLTMNWYANDEARAGAYGRWLFGVNQSYVSMVNSAGAIPVGILPAAEPHSGLLRGLDLLILTGGGDPDPALYGRANCGSLNCRRERPLWEMDLYRTARKTGLPVFGICLGIQLIAIAEGEELIQDIESSLGSAVDHHGRPHDPRRHSVRIAGGTLLHRLFGDETVVSSFHHQAVFEVPKGFVRSAVSRDGVIEAIESDDGKVLGVQWHPERDDTGAPLLEALLKKKDH